MLPKKILAKIIIVKNKWKLLMILIIMEQKRKLHLIKILRSNKIKTQQFLKIIQDLQMKYHIIKKRRKDLTLKNQISID